MLDGGMDVSITPSNMIPSNIPHRTSPHPPASIFTMGSDIRVGLRLLWKDKAFSLTAALTLALCIGANTALFSVVHNVLLRPLPVPESERIVRMGNAYPGAGAGAAAGDNSAVPDYYDRLRETDVFEEQALFNSANQSIDQNGVPVRVRVTRAT